MRYFAGATPAQLAQSEELRAAFGLGAVSLSQYGLGPATTDITPVVNAAKAAGWDKVVVPAKNMPVAGWPMLTTLTASDLWIDFEPGAKINMTMDARAMDLTACRLTNAYLTSPYTGPASASDASGTGRYRMFAREVRLGSNCVVENHYHENAAGGLHVDGTNGGDNISVRNVTFKNIRQYQGWGAALHVSGSSCFNIHMDGIKITDSDRGCEFEAGCRDVSADNGYQENVYPKSYTGQPADFATYTFCLGAHSHSGEGACVNVSHKNWLLKNCGSAVTFVRSNGTGLTDHPRSCSAENIHIFGMAMSTGYEAIAVQGYNNVVRGVHMEEGAGLTALMRIRFWGGNSENNRIEDVRAAAFALPLVTVDDQAVGTSLGNFRPGTALVGTGYIFDIAGRYTLISGTTAFSVTGTSGYVRFQATADYSQIDGFNYNTATTETFTQHILIDGAENVRISGVQGSNYATTPPFDVRLATGTRFANISGNNFDRANGTLFQLDSGASRNYIGNNVWTNANAFITDAGIENTMVGNKRGNWVDRNRNVATIADGASSVTVTHGVAGAPETVMVAPRLGELLWVSAISGTTFTVTRAGTTGAHTFSWQADNVPSV